MTKKEINAHPFVKWIKSKRAYNAWKRNLTMGEKNALKYTPDTISGTFFWASSPEGHEYWKELDEKWRKELERES